jgi:hypothetical protein
VSSPVSRVPRECPLCGNPTLTEALMEAHVGPTRRYPRADVVLWLCPPCALKVTYPGSHGTGQGGRRR